MDKTIFGFYSNYLPGYFGQVTASGSARLLDGEVSYDQVSHMMADKKLTSKFWWQIVKPFIDSKVNREKQRSQTTKNEHYRNMLKAVVGNQISSQYMLNDLWFSSAENMRYVK